MLARIINIKIQKLWIKYDGMMQRVVMCPKLMKLTGIDKVEFTGLHLIRCSGNDAMQGSFFNIEKFQFVMPVGGDRIETIFISMSIYLQRNIGVP